MKTPRFHPGDIIYGNEGYIERLTILRIEGLQYITNQVYEHEHEIAVYPGEVPRWIDKLDENFNLDESNRVDRILTKYTL